MIYKEEELRACLEGRSILIAGFGREGRSTQALLQQLLPEVQPVVVEGNENIRAEAVKHYDLILKSPGIPMSVFDGVCAEETISSQTDIFLQVYGQQTIGVTGTKGKSTTTHLIYYILQEHFRHAAPAARPADDSAPQGHTYLNVLKAGNMGIPLFDVLPMLNQNSLVVCEFSCHQLENIHRAPHVAVLLNLYQEHLDHYRSYRDYQMAKLQIGLKQQAGDYFFYCQDNEELRQRVEECATALQGQVQAYSTQEALRWQQVPTTLQGVHNMGNIEVASRVAALFGVTWEECAQVLPQFQGLEHRLEPVGKYQGVLFYNDSISTIPQSTIAAVEALHEVDTLILGGFDRGIDYSSLIDYLQAPDTAGSHIRNLAFVGAAGRRMLSLLQERTQGQLRQHILVEDDYDKIVPWCFRHTARGKCCLLSPAAASYDRFRNFEERGSVFKNLVRSYGTATQETPIPSREQ